MNLRVEFMGAYRGKIDLHYTLNNELIQVVDPNKVHSAGYIIKEDIPEAARNVTLIFYSYIEKPFKQWREWIVSKDIDTMCDKTIRITGTIYKSNYTIDPPLFTPALATQKTITLPFKVGDKIFKVYDKDYYEMHTIDYVEIKFIDNTNTPCYTFVYNNNCYFSTEDIGKTIFYDLRDAKEAMAKW